MRHTLPLLLCLLAAAPSLAKKRYAKKEGQECGHCHHNPQGGGSRNTVGLYYQAHHELPDAGMDEAAVKSAVDAWAAQVAATPPNIVWRHTDVFTLPDEPPPEYRPATDLEVLRRLSLDLRGALPGVGDIDRVQRGEATLDQIVEEYFRTEDFARTFRLYHADQVRPRTGIFNKPASLSRLSRPKIGGRKVWSSQRIRGETRSAACRDGAVKVSPYWARDKEQWACRATADESVVLEDGTRCDTEEGQKTGRCGCGPHLVFCYRGSDRKRVKQSMVQEGARLAMEVVLNDEPYSQVVRADWTMRNGRLDHFYARLNGTLGELADPDSNRAWRRVERGEGHAGVLSTHMFLNFFYNGRRWAQRAFESFACHEVTPDYDLLDDHRGETFASYRPHPEAGPDMNVNAGRACAACHVQLDGLSRVKDRWDNFGQYYSDNPVPQTVVFLGEKVDGVGEFGDVLGASNVFADCVANQAWEHFSGHRFQPDEVLLRKQLVRAFAESGQSFKALLRAIVGSDAYRSETTLKLMRRELYWRSMERLTGARWNIGKRRGFDVFYDKVGGMDYRKIEGRDVSPGQGHSMVQFKAALETCDKVVNRDRKAAPGKRWMLGGVESVDAQPDDAQLKAVQDDWYRRLYARPADAVPAADRAIMTSVFRDVAGAHSPADGYKAMCATFFASSDFAIY